jgi:hypothetical protein
MWSLNCPQVFVGFFPILSKSRINPSPILSPCFQFSKLNLQALENQVSIIGLSEELIDMRHDLIRESVNFDTLSTKSWSDVDNGSEASPREPPLPIRQPTKADLLDPTLLKSVCLAEISLHSAFPFLTSEYE